MDRIGMLRADRSLSAVLRKICVAVASTGLPIGLLAATPDFTDLPLEDLLRVEITSASKFSQSSNEAPSAVQVITAADIRQNGWQTLGEALASLPGLYRVSDKAYEYIGARGFLVPGDYNTRFLLLLDGQSTNDNIYDQASFSREFAVDLATIARIEYVPGPGSSIYGSNALFGVINVITRKAQDMPPLVLSTHLGSNGWQGARAAVAVKGEGEGPDLVLSVSHALKNGRDLTYSRAAGLITASGEPSPDGVAHDLDTARVTRAFLGLRQGGWSLSAWAAKRVVNPSSALYGANFDDDRLRVEDQQYGLSTAYSAAINDTLHFDGRLAYQRVTYQGDYPFFDDGGVGAYLNRDDSVGAWWSGEARTLYTGIAHHKLIVGVDFKSDVEASQKNADVGVSVDDPLDVKHLGRRRGVFVQDEWHFADDWRLNAGVRRDWYSSGLSHTSPRFGLVWSVTGQTTLKLLAGRSYRVPNAYERLYGNGSNYLANSSLKPETIRTVEFVAEYRPSVGHEIGASLFDYRLRDPIRQVDVGGDIFQYQNQDAITAKGVETYYRMRFSSGLNLTASLALTRARDAMGDRPGNSPNWIAKLHAGVPFWGDRLLAGFEVLGIGNRVIDRSGERDRIASQAQFNATLTAPGVLSGLDAQLRIVNVFDQPLAHPGSDEAPVSKIPFDERRVELGLTYAF